MTENQNFKIWQSPFTTEEVFGEILSFSLPFVDASGIYYLERRPLERGRNVLVRKSFEHEKKELFPQEFNAKSKVHEYGGGSFQKFKENLYLVNQKDQQVYQIKEGRYPKRITSNLQKRYTDGSIHPTTQKLYYVCEEHFESEEPQNSLVMIDPDYSHETVIAEGHDFYASPRISQDGKYLAYIYWDHPHMPWDESVLVLQHLTPEGTLGEEKIRIRAPHTSVVEPSFSPNGDLYFIWDKSGFANLYCYKNKKIECVLSTQREFGLPHWVFGRRTYAFFHMWGTLSIVCSCFDRGNQELWVIKEGFIEKIQTPFQSFDDLFVYQNTLYFIGGSYVDTPQLVALDLHTKNWEIVENSSKKRLDPSYISTPERIEFKTQDKKIGYSYFYPPKNPNHLSLQKPPLLVRVHGGPTTLALPVLNLGIQFWTSRGFAVVDVNYRGSTGFGRDYREELKGSWGIKDVLDCESCIQSLKERIDPKKIFIRGRSSGGFTVLSALVQFPELFCGATSYYGIADLLSFSTWGHKFESHYLEALVGGKKLYKERSPITHVEKVSCPVLLIQGKDDLIVPFQQSKQFYEALLKMKKPAAFLVFEKEGHGFTDKENNKKALLSELSFYSQILGLSASEDTEEIKIENFE